MIIKNHQCPTKNKIRTYNSRFLTSFGMTTSLCWEGGEEAAAAAAAAEEERVRTRKTRPYPHLLL